LAIKEFAVRIQVSFRALAIDAPKVSNNLVVSGAEFAPTLKNAEYADDKQQASNEYPSRVAHNWCCLSRFARRTSEQAMMFSSSHANMSRTTMSAMKQRVPMMSSSVNHWIRSVCSGDLIANLSPSHGSPDQ